MIIFSRYHCPLTYPVPNDSTLVPLFGVNARTPVEVRVASMIPSCELVHSHLFLIPTLP